MRRHRWRPSQPRRAPHCRGASPRSAQLARTPDPRCMRGPACDDSKANLANFLPHVDAPSRAEASEVVVRKSTAKSCNRPSDQTESPLNPNKILLAVVRRPCLSVRGREGNFALLTEPAARGPRPRRADTTAEMRRVLVMSSSGLASSTMKSALLPACSVPASAIRRNSAELRVAATMTCIGVIPASTMSNISSCGTPRPVAVGAERDAHARRIQLRQVARLNPVQGLRLRPVGVGRFELLELGGRQARPQPAQIHLHAAIRQVRREDQVRTLP